MPDNDNWDDAAILRRLEAAEASLLIAKQAAIAWQKGNIPVGESPISHVIASNAVESGIAAADVICELQLGQHNRSHNHRDAVQMLRQVNRQLADTLRDLIDAKNEAQYSPEIMHIQQAIILVNKARSLYDNARIRAVNRRLPAKSQSPRPL